VIFVLYKSFAVYLMSAEPHIKHRPILAFLTVECFLLFLGHLVIRVMLFR